MNSGDTAFMIISAALVFFMTPGLAFFYGGLVRRKNVVNTMMGCVAIIGIATLVWAERRGHGSWAIRGQYSAPHLLRLPDDVCRDNAGAAHWIACRARAL